MSKKLELLHTCVVVDSIDLISSNNLYIVWLSRLMFIVTAQTIPTLQSATICCTHSSFEALIYPVLVLHSKSRPESGQICLCTRPLARLFLAADKIGNDKKYFRLPHEHTTRGLVFFNNPKSNPRTPIILRLVHCCYYIRSFHYTTHVFTMAATSVEEPHKLFDTILTLDFG